MSIYFTIKQVQTCRFKELQKKKKILFCDKLDAGVCKQN